MTHPLKGKCAIAGLGLTPMGRVYDSAMGFAVEAVRLALEDAGLERSDLDGLCLNPGLAWGDVPMGSFALQQALGLRDLRYSVAMNLGGASAAAMVQNAALAIAAGMATTVACVFSDAPLKPPKTSDGKKASSASAYGFASGLNAAYGQFGVNALYALVANRHMHRYGTTNDDLGAVAVAERAWANRNPAAPATAMQLNSSTPCATTSSKNGRPFPAPIARPATAPSRIPFWMSMYIVPSPIRIPPAKARNVT